MPLKDPVKLKEYKAQWHQNNKERLNKKAKVYWDTIKDTVKPNTRLRCIKRMYNLDAEDYYYMLKVQENKCAICFKLETVKYKTGDTKALCVDHDHSTGKVRALLCNHCNAMLGYARDNIDTLKEAIEYLEKHKEN